MNFYEALSPYYDALFPVDAGEMSFIRRRFSGRRHLLDIGCGTGNKTVHLSSVVQQISAFDSDPAMIERAMLENKRPNIEYTVLDMSCLTSAFPEAMFDGALCLGNTLVHIPSLADIGDFLRMTTDVMQPKGLFLAQILNYDRILDLNITSLPDLVSESAIFSRRYERDGSAVRFLTTLATADGATYTNDIPLYPLRRSELNGCLLHAGFDSLQWFGSYEGTPLTQDSFVCIVSCTKA